MSITNGHSRKTSKTPLVSSVTGPHRPLHRVRIVRNQQGVSLRTVAKKLGIETREARSQEDPDADLPLSVLYQWQRALEVPVANLLVDLDAPVSPPVLRRAQLLKLAKSAVTIVERAESKQIGRLAQRMIDQLIELMPELKEVTAWPDVGQRRSLGEYGRIIETMLPDDELLE